MVVAGPISNLLVAVFYVVAGLRFVILVRVLSIGLFVVLVMTGSNMCMIFLCFVRRESILVLSRIRRG